MKRLLFLFIGLYACFISFAQSDSNPYADWVKKLSDKNGPANSGIEEISAVVNEKDSIQSIAIFNELEKIANKKNHFFLARFYATKIKWQAKPKSSELHEKNINDWTKLALNAAYETNNDSLIAEIAWIAGIAYYQLEKVEPCAMYLLFAAEMDEKIGRITDAGRCIWLSSVLYKTRDYKKAIYYTLAAIEREKDTSALTRRLTVSRYNTVGVCYQRIENYDSAFFYYDIAMKLAKDQRNTIWQAIISGNKGQIYFLQKNYPLAKSLLAFEYSIMKEPFEERLSTANTLQWLAKIDLQEGKKDSALIRIKQAFQFISYRNNASWPNYSQNVYSTAAEVYRAFGNNDSVLKYSQLYNNIRDSIERAVADSRLEISRIKLDNLQSSLAIKNLQKEKNAEEQKRNLVIVLIILVSVIALLYVNRLRLKHLHKEQLARQEKIAAEASAREQLQLLTQKITDETKLVEELQKQLNNRTHSIEQQELAATISNLTILTEADWEKFKKLFEQLHPGFFMNLQEKVSDITLAELRMAALTRLHLTTNQIASILGISANSVYKTKQRLRHRLNLDSDANIEDAIAIM